MENQASSSSAVNAYDVVIVGGGMVGASLALALKNSGLKLAVIEAHAMADFNGKSSYQPSYDGRSTALSWGTRCIYERLGLWQVLSEHVTAIRHIQVSDKGRFGATRLHAGDYGVEALGYVVPNAWMGAVLHAAIAEQATQSSIDWLCPARVERIAKMIGHSEVYLASSVSEIPACISARLLVVADGGRSGLTEALGIDIQQQPYRQHAVIANLSTGQHHGFWAYERFTPNGPMALLPLGEQAESDPGQCALVWTLPDDQVDEILALDDKAFCRAVQQAFGYRLGEIYQVGTRAHYPLVLAQAKEQIRPGLVIVGNAAHALHPVAGQGYNLALRDVMALAEELVRAQRSDQDIASMPVLNRYLERQTQDQAITIQFSDGVTRLFSNDHSVVGLFRDMGLIGLDMVPALKSRFARHAMGLGGREARW